MSREVTVSAPKHTPGPWEVLENPEGLPIIESQHGTIAHVRMHVSATGPEVDANARLIAAAPELLDALKEHALPSVSEWAGWDRAGREALEKLLALIAKAEGTTK